ncbi:DUF6283 family protein [Kitasatospora sp. NPDC057542]|uniref:DUF6283 family protein n=1 Tax=Kitasatospora sp. NPDC057542 TaxID=3346162 RepID=UPI0036866535
MPRDPVISTIRPPAPRPCDSCPYRRDVPSGIWAAEEYEKLRAYDAPTGEQPTAMFQCHQNDADSQASRVCAGWAGCHGEALLAPRIALLTAAMDGPTLEAVVTYVSPVPLFSSGAEAADHGQADIDRPGPEADRLIDKIIRTRRDIRLG